MSGGNTGCRAFGRASNSSDMSPDRRNAAFHMATCSSPAGTPPGASLRRARQVDRDAGGVRHSMRTQTHGPVSPIMIAHRVDNSTRLVPESASGLLAARERAMSWTAASSCSRDVKQRDTRPSAAASAPPTRRALSASSAATPAR